MAPVRVGASLKGICNADMKYWFVIKPLCTSNIPYHKSLSSTAQLNVGKSTASLSLSDFGLTLNSDLKNRSNDYLLSRGIAVRYLLSYGLENALRITLGKKEELNQTIKALKEFVINND